jgi:Uncharacterised nucleotidyltransferase
MEDQALSPEFRLAATCCRWPPSPARNEAVCAAAAGVSDWKRFVWTANRQRVVGLVHDALSTAAVEMPRETSEALASQARRLARQNVIFAAEAVRLQDLLIPAQIPVLILKGLPLAQLAYSSHAIKQTRDIDLLVLPAQAETALALLEREGYEALPPAAQPGTAQWRAFAHYAREVELRHRNSGMIIELQWRLTGNPLLLRGIDARAATQEVTLDGGSCVRTLAGGDLFAHLCVHGAGHAWSRLKWLADLNALLATRDGDIAQLYQYAQSSGAGLCAGQALLLCQLLFDTKLPPALAEELQRHGRVRRLVRIALNAMANPSAKPDDAIAVSNNILYQFLLGQGFAFFFAQCRIAAVGILDVLAFPLPPRLHFLYPVLRLPLWAWRRTTGRVSG